ncbi:MAG: DUF4416 family protein, partial [Candidatus Omnitrophota bacterium]
NYYKQEFGSPLLRKLVCFERLVSLENICEIKKTSNAIEEKTSVAGRRTVNIDPGYITEAKVVLLTTKDYSHRIYIGSRIFAECTLYFNDGAFKPWPWTYPDYASKEIVDFFCRAREKYRQDARGRE